jgi:hypothetical protein
VSMYFASNCDMLWTVVVVAGFLKLTVIWGRGLPRLWPFLGSGKCRESRHNVESRYQQVKQNIGTF